MINITKKLTTKNCYVNKNKPRYIVIHETDNTSKGAGAERHATAMYNGNLQGTVHYYVDDRSIYQTLEHKHGAYAIGDNGNKINSSKYGIHNQNSINIEICVNPDNNYDKTVANVVDLVKKIMREENINISNVVRHYDATRKNCPRKMIAKKGAWEDFKNKLKVSDNMGQTKKYKNCILYSGDIDKAIATCMSFHLEDCIVKDVKDHLKWEGFNLFVVGGACNTFKSEERFTKIMGSDRKATHEEMLKFINK